MKYADKVIELMASYPGRDFRMVELIRYINPAPKTNKERTALHVTVWRAIKALESSGAVMVRQSKSNGGYATYRWKTIT